MNMARYNYINHARRKIAKLLIFGYPDAKLDELPDVLVHSFNALTEILRKKNIGYAYFRTWWELKDRYTSSWWYDDEVEYGRK